MPPADLLFGCHSPALDVTGETPGRRVSHTDK
jgi:hypothetical protein